MPFLPDLHLTPLSSAALREFLCELLEPARDSGVISLPAPCCRGTLVQRALLARASLDARLCRQLETLDLKLVADPTLGRLLTVGRALEQTRAWLKRTGPARGQGTGDGTTSPASALMPVHPPGEVVRLLAALVAERHSSLACLGPSRTALQALQQGLLQEQPSLSFLGVPVEGELWGPENDRLLRLLCQARPAVLLVGLGSPLQEEWIQAHADLLPCRLLLGIGPLTGQGILA